MDALTPSIYRRWRSGDETYASRTMDGSHQSEAQEDRSTQPVTLSPAAVGPVPAPPPTSDRRRRLSHHRLPLARPISSSPHHRTHPAVRGLDSYGGLKLQPQPVTIAGANAPAPARALRRGPHQQATFFDLVVLRLAKCLSICNRV
ncbi:hypothetical protein ZWY2020_038574 [Hordeum vulgare]|nr:hypothetical protein ZWY2020_038574 [Hordeum vulgare]